MARQTIDPKDYGVNLTKGEFTDLMVGEMAEYTRGTISLDNMLLRPRTALHFCDSVRQRHGFFDLPDDIILRAIMTRRKNA
jgi:hypothetical protein